MACMGLFFLLGLLFALLAVSCFLVSVLWVTHVAMSYGAITTESAMCTYFEEFSCVKRTVRTLGVQAKTGPVWEANFRRANFSTSDSNFSGECRVTDSSDSWKSLVAFMPNAKEDAYMFEGFTPGEPTFQASSLVECNESAINYTSALRPCSVETSSVSGGKQMCGKFTSEDVFAFNMKTLGSAGFAILVGIMLQCIARCCAKNSATSGSHVQLSSSERGYHGGTPMTVLPEETSAAVRRVEKGGNIRLNHDTGYVTLIRPLDFQTRKSANDLKVQEFQDQKEAESICKDLAELSNIFRCDMTIEEHRGSKDQSAAESAFWQTVAENRARIVAEAMIDFGANPNLLHTRGVAGLHVHEARTQVFMHIRNIKDAEVGDASKVTHGTQLLTVGKATSEQTNDHFSGFLSTLCAGCGRSRTLSQRPH